MKNFLTSATFKKLASDVSRQSGIKESAIMLVWEYTFFQWLLTFAKNSKNEKGEFELVIPFLGTAKFKLGDEYVEDDKILVDIQSSLDIDQTFQKYVGDVQAGDVSQLKDFLENQIENVVNKII